MTVTNSESRTSVHEIAAGIYRISTPVDQIPGGFTFNQILVVDDEPLLFHTGLRRMFPLVKEAVAHVLGDVAKLRYVGFSHFESDECGSLNEWLAVAPRAEPVCSTIGAMVSVNDFAVRPARALADGQELSLGKKSMRWIDAPHLPHNWECGYMVETTTHTLLCGDLFTQGGSEHPPITEGDILGPSEAMRKAMGGVAVEAHARTLIEKLASTEPVTLATMHGSSFRGNGRALLLAFADALGV
ncbi:MAG TPA: MBL fold metallo-hydrolase [Polyangiaceae bacterium]